MDLPPIPLGLPASRSMVETARDRAKSEATGPDTDAAAHKAAEAYEATFLAEMLKDAGLNKMPEGYGGGEGEQAFSSFLTQEYAKKISERGGIGLAEQIFEILRRREQP